MNLSAWILYASMNFYLMLKRYFFIIISSAIFFGLMACCEKSFEFFDRGLLADERYRFDFGVLRPGVVSKSTFTSPSSDRFCFGLERKGVDISDLSGVKVNFELHSKDDLLLKESGFLNQWTVSDVQGNIFIYKRDRGTSCYALKRGQSYTASIELNSNDGIVGAFTFIARGGGWK